MIMCNNIDTPPPGDLDESCVMLLLLTCSVLGNLVCRSRYCLGIRRERKMEDGIEEQNLVYPFSS